MIIYTLFCSRMNYCLNVAHLELFLSTRTKDYWNMGEMVNWSRFYISHFFRLGIIMSISGLSSCITQILEAHITTCLHLLSLSSILNTVGNKFLLPCCWYVMSYHAASHLQQPDSIYMAYIVCLRSALPLSPHSELPWLSGDFNQGLLSLRPTVYPLHQTGSFYCPT